MGNYCDVLEASYGSAANIVSTLYNYGDGDLGEGVRGFGESCYEQGAVDIVPLARRQGRWEGGILAGGIFCAIWLYSRARNKKKTSRKEENNEIDNSEMREEN